MDKPAALNGVLVDWVFHFSLPSYYSSTRWWNGQGPIFVFFTFPLATRVLLQRHKVRFSLVRVGFLYCLYRVFRVVILDVWTSASSVCHASIRIDRMLALSFSELVNLCALRHLIGTIRLHSCYKYRINSVLLILCNCSIRY